MKPINTLQYLLKIVTHNVNLLYVIAVMSFYLLGDKIEEWWYVNIEKGNSLDHHVKKMVVNFNTSTVVKKFVIALYILRKLNLQQDKLDASASLFKPSFILEFTIDRDYLDWINKLEKIKDVSGIMRFMVYATITTTRQLAYVLGDDLFEKFRTSSIDDIYKFVSTEEVARLQKESQK